MSRRRRGREESRVEDHLGPHPLSSRTWLLSPWFPSHPAGQKGKRREERRGLPSPSFDPSLPGKGSVWLLLKAGNKGPN